MAVSSKSICNIQNKKIHGELCNSDLPTDSVLKGDLLFKFLKQYSSFQNILSMYPIDENF